MHFPFKFLRWTQPTARFGTLVQLKRVMPVLQRRGSLWSRLLPSKKTESDAIKSFEDYNDESGIEFITLGMVNLSTTPYYPIHYLNNASSSNNNNNNTGTTAVVDSCASSLLEPEEVEMTNISESECKKTTQKTTKKLKIPSSTTVLNQCNRGLISLFPEAFSQFSNSPEQIQMCCNQLTEIPVEIYHFRQLKRLDLANNQLQILPPEIGLLQHLEELILSRNKLSSLPTSLSGLQSLKRICLDSNNFSELPRPLLQLNPRQLITLEIHSNPKLQFIPAEIVHFSQLARFHIEGCPDALNESQFAAFERENSSKQTPSLLECSARSLIRNRRGVLWSLPQHLKVMLSRAQICSFCSGPMIDCRVVKCRMIKRMERQIPVVSELCCNHWQSEEDRLQALLSPIPKTTPPHLLGELEYAPNCIPFNRFDPQTLAKGTRILAKFTPEQLINLQIPLSLIVDYGIKSKIF